MSQKAAGRNRGDLWSTTSALTLEWRVPVHHWTPVNDEERIGSHQQVAIICIYHLSSFKSVHSNKSRQIGFPLRGVNAVTFAKTEGYNWARSDVRVLHSQQTFYIRRTNQKTAIRTPDTLQFDKQYKAKSWKTFDGYVNSQKKMWKIVMNIEDWIFSSCTCPSFLNFSYVSTSLD